MSDNGINISELRICWAHHEHACFVCLARDVPDFMWLTLAEESALYVGWLPEGLTPPF